jgi:L-ascorbate metabolism protein UlaG (beta-lactamase superfamily)
MGEVIELEPGERCTIAGAELEAIPAEHDGRRHPLGADMPALGFLVSGPARVYFAGDTDLFGGMAALAGRVDVALLPVWGWGPRLPAGHLNPETAADAAALVRPAVAVPIHWGTMRSVGTPTGAGARAPAEAFAAALASRSVSVEARILEPGDSMPLHP